MITYLLDTNICIYILKRKPLNVFQKFRETDPDAIGVSSITVAELMFGVSKSLTPEKNLAEVTELLKLLQVVDFDQEAAIHYGAIKATLYKNGTPIGPLDMLIAGHAKRMNVILVSNNLKEFDRVEGLLTENWVE